MSKTKSASSVSPDLENPLVISDGLFATDVRGFLVMTRERPVVVACEPDLYFVLAAGRVVAEAAKNAVLSIAEHVSAQMPWSRPSKAPARGLAGRKVKHGATRTGRRVSR